MKPGANHEPTTVTDPSAAWRELLKQQPASYRHVCNSRADFRRARRLGLVWRRVLRLAPVPKNGGLFELGCGGGHHLAKLAIQGFQVHGLDISAEVVERTREYLSSVSQFAPIRASVEVGNFLDYDTHSRAEHFDLVYHVGVVEHFLDAGQRALIWNKMRELARPGGWIVSIVPCGMHLLRQRARTEGLLGYNIPEIDYSCDLHTREFEAAGLSKVRCVSHNYFGFLPAAHAPWSSAPIRQPTLLAANAVLPWLPISEHWKELIATTLIAVGQNA